MYSPEPDIEAILYALNAILEKNLSNKHVVVCSESILAVNSFYIGLEFNFPLLVPDYDIATLHNCSICIKYVCSDLNSNADNLAKPCLLRSTVLCS